MRSFPPRCRSHRLLPEMKNSFDGIAQTKTFSGVFFPTWSRPALLISQNIRRRSDGHFSLASVPPSRIPQCLIWDAKRSFSEETDPFSPFFFLRKGVRFLLLSKKQERFSLDTSHAPFQAMKVRKSLPPVVSQKTGSRHFA